MLNKAILILSLIFSTSLFASSDMSQNDKVEKVFKKMVRAYKNENKKSFFHYVSENKFQQDYLSFYDSIDEDLNKNDILSTNIWINKITEDGKKRFLYVKWTKRYHSANSDKVINKEGNTRFLFEKIKSKYKLIAFNGDLFWGVSKP